MLTYHLSLSMIEHIRSMLLQFAPWKSSHSGNLKQAAVGIILVSADEGSNETSFLLTLRSAKLRSHAGQYALPGGRVEQGETPVDAVIRECMEEIGLQLSVDEVLGTLDLYVTRSGYAITPVVFAVAGQPGFSLNPREVQQLFRIRLSDFSGDRAAQFSSQEGGPLLIRFPIFDHHLHAPTAAILYQFLELVAGRYQQVDDLEAPEFATR